MNDTIMATFSVQPSGNVGQVVLDPDGKIIAWTTDSWIAQVIAKLLSENEELLSQRRNDNGEDDQRNRPPTLERH